MRPSRTAPARAFARSSTTLLLAVLLVAGCGGQPVPSNGLGTTRGGASYLPGPLAAGASVAPADSASPNAPDFTLKLLDGTSVTASDLWSDRPLVLDFFATYCTICANAQSDLDQLAGEFQGRVAFLGVTGTQDTAAAIATYLDAHAVPYAVALDGDGQAWLKYAAHEPPLIALVSKGGRLLAGWTGDVDMAMLRQKLVEQAGAP